MFLTTKYRNKFKEDDMLYILWFLLIGFVVGLIAKAIHPGKEPGGLMATMVIGIAGSFIGGMINWLIAGGSFGPAGIIMSVIGGVIFCWAYGKYNLSRYIPLGDKESDDDVTE